MKKQMLNIFKHGLYSASKKSKMLSSINIENGNGIKKEDKYKFKFFLMLPCKELII